MSDPVIDLTTLRRLFKNDRESIQEWITLYLAETPAYFRQISEEAATNAADVVGRSLHDLRPMAHYLGAPRMLVLCDAIKELSAASDPNAVHESIHELLSLAERIEVALNAELNKV